MHFLEITFEGGTGGWEQEKKKSHLKNQTAYKYLEFKCYVYLDRNKT